MALNITCLQMVSKGRQRHPDGVRPAEGEFPRPGLQLSAAGPTDRSQSRVVEGFHGPAEDHQEGREEGSQRC